jgi:hypothetical protein
MMDQVKLNPLGTKASNLEPCRDALCHLKRILHLDRLRLRGPCGAHDEFLLAATAQNLRKLAKLIPASQSAFVT